MAQRMTTRTYKIPTCGGGSRCLRSTRRHLVHTVRLSYNCVYSICFYLNSPVCETHPWASGMSWLLKDTDPERNNGKTEQLGIPSFTQ